MDKRTVIYYAITTVLIVGSALFLSEAPLDAERLGDAFALAFIITVLSLQAWLRRRNHPRKPTAAETPCSSVAGM